MRNTSNATGKQAFTRKAFTRKTFVFLRQVNRNPNLRATDTKVGVQLTDHFNINDGGRAFPSCKKIGEKAGLSEATVIRSIRRLVAEGHLKVVWGRPGRGHPNQYWMVIKPSSAQVSPSDRKQTTKDLKPAPVQENHKLLLKKKLGENSASRFFNVERAADAALDLKEEAFRKKQEKNSIAKLGSTLRPSMLRPNPDFEKTVAACYCKNTKLGSALLPNPDFETLQAIWCRPWPDDEVADRLAFERAITAGAATTEILEAAKCWVAAADAPRFLPRLDRWLSGRGWLKVPPRRRQRTGGHRRRRFTHAEVFAGIMAEISKPTLTYRDLFPEVA
jgi:hypothetical protein